VALVAQVTDAKAAIEASAASEAAARVSAPCVRALPRAQARLHPPIHPGCYYPPHTPNHGPQAEARQMAAQAGELKLTADKCLELVTSYRTEVDRGAAERMAMAAQAKEQERLLAKAVISLRDTRVECEALRKQKTSLEALCRALQAERRSAALVVDAAGAASAVAAGGAGASGPTTTGAAPASSAAATGDQGDAPATAPAVPAVPAPCVSDAESVPSVGASEGGGRHASRDSSPVNPRRRGDGADGGEMAAVSGGEAEAGVHGVGEVAGGPPAVPTSSGVAAGGVGGGSVHASPPRSSAPPGLSAGSDVLVMVEVDA